MNTVKGSKQYRLRVVRHQPWKGFLWGVGLLGLFAIGVAGSYVVGLEQGLSKQEGALQERDALKMALNEREAQVAQLRQSVANLKLGAQVDRQASEGVREEVIELKDQVAALEEDISFYRGLMSPSGNNRGLTIGSLDVISTGVPRQYEYKVVVQQLATRHSTLSGSLKFNIVGHQGEQLITLPLKDVSDNVSYENIKLRFKYFQTIQGRLNLPDGFEPERIELTARSTGDNAAQVDKKFGWLVQES